MARAARVPVQASYEAAATGGRRPARRRRSWPHPCPRAGSSTALQGRGPHRRRGRRLAHPQPQPQGPLGPGARRDDPPHRDLGHRSTPSSSAATATRACPARCATASSPRTARVHLVGYGRANHAGLGDDDVLRAVIAEKAPPAGQRGQHRRQPPLLRLRVREPRRRQGPLARGPAGGHRAASAAHLPPHGWTAALGDRPPGMAAGQGRPARLHDGRHARPDPRPSEVAARRAGAAPTSAPVSVSDNGRVTGQPTPPPKRSTSPPCGPGCRRRCRRSTDERFARHGVRLLLKRDDLIHPELRRQQVAQARPQPAGRRRAARCSPSAARTPTTCGPPPPPAGCSGCPPSAWSAATSWPTAR